MNFYCVVAYRDGVHLAKNATIQYSSVSVCVCVCAYYSKSYLSRNMKLEYTVVYENISDKFHNLQCRIKVKVMAQL